MNEKRFSYKGYENKCDWRNGNAYRFKVFDIDGCRGWVVSNGHYSITLSNPREANDVKELLNKVQIGNGDGFSKKELMTKMSVMKKSYLKHEGITLSEKILVRQIFRTITEVIK